MFKIKQILLKQKKKRKEKKKKKGKEKQKKKKKTNGNKRKNKILFDENKNLKNINKKLNEEIRTLKQYKDQIKLLQEEIHKEEEQKPEKEKPSEEVPKEGKKGKKRIGIKKRKRRTYAKKNKSIKRNYL